MTIKSGASSPTPTASANGSAQSSTLQDFKASLAAGQGGSDAGRVWTPGPAPEALGAKAPQTPQEFGGTWSTIDEATNQYFNWTQKQRDDFRAKGLLSGLLTQGA